MPELVKQPRYKVGDQLQLKSRGPQWVGTVTDARGTYSPTGHVLYRIRVPTEPEPVFLLVREEEVADPLVLSKFAQEVQVLLRSAKVQDRFRRRCLEYLRERAETDRPPPMDLIRDNKSSQLTLPAKYALLTALHNVLCPAKDELDPLGKPQEITWEQFAERDPEGYKNAVRWAALVNQVSEWLAPENADDIQSWLEAVRADLQNNPKARSGKGRHKGK